MLPELLLVGGFQLLSVLSSIGGAAVAEGKHEQVVDVVPDHSNRLGPHQLTARNKPDQGQATAIYSTHHSPLQDSTLPGPALCDVQTPPPGTLRCVADLLVTIILSVSCASIVFTSRPCPVPTVHCPINTS
ncbi:hypothetical protein RRG08_008830 [Elysia crispata]|uniref:Secreted protein n=1 Tax=Elysia crispata TaxID=231223 RepID=A0AAE1EAD5_9GAST|nr:hypothetical protein RRG08_008830 [Elysia crispata]